MYICVHEQEHEQDRKPRQVKWSQAGVLKYENKQERKCKQMKQSQAEFCEMEKNQ